VCTAYILALIFVVTHIPVETDLFDPIAKAFEDFEISDIVYTEPEPGEEDKALRPPTTADTNIVLVNIQNLNRAQLAQQIEILNKYEPAVIGIDAFFRKEKGPDMDFPLEMALSQVKNLVLVSELEGGLEETGCFDSVSTSHPMFNQYAHNGFANVIAAAEGKGFRTVKDFYPYYCVADTTYPNFTVKVASFFDPAAVERLKERGHEEEYINWRGRYNKFLALDWDDVLLEKYDLSFIKGKIVLMGYLGPRLGEYDLIDIFYTPQNKRVAGRSYPDTYGVTVHANVISQILHGNYLWYMPDWATRLLIFIITYLNVALFIYIGDKRRTMYDLFTKGIQLVEVALFMFVIVMLMLKFGIKVNLTFLFASIVICGDLTEVYIGSLKPWGKQKLSKWLN
jgi:CHASE2 domain-containing sensor protein